MISADIDVFSVATDKGTLKCGSCKWNFLYNSLTWWSGNHVTDLNSRNTCRFDIVKSINVLLALFLLHLMPWWFFNYQISIIWLNVKLSSVK
jgi:hypothetical protein